MFGAALNQCLKNELSRSFVTIVRVLVAFYSTSPRINIAMNVYFYAVKTSAKTTLDSIGKEKDV